LVVTANVIPSSPILVTLLMEALSCSETSFLTRFERLNIQEHGILHSQHRENLKYYNVVPSSPILATLMMQALCSSETSLLTRATPRNIPEDGILHSHPMKTSSLS
jgi:hypothetical protein